MSLINPRASARTVTSFNSVTVSVGITPTPYPYTATVVIGGYSYVANAVSPRRALARAIRAFRAVVTNYANAPLVGIYLIGDTYAATATGRIGVA